VKRALALALALAAASCDGATAPTRGVRLGEEFELRPGESALLEQELLAITFDGVSDDSRCPIDVVCIWEGDAVVRVTARRLPRTEARLELHTQPDRSEAGFQGYRIRLVSLAPRPRAGQPVPARDYVARLVVTRP
jgi:hypothetical protein